MGGMPPGPPQTVGQVLAARELASTQMISHQMVGGKGLGSARIAPISLKEMEMMSGGKGKGVAPAHDNILVGMGHPSAGIAGMPPPITSSRAATAGGMSTLPSQQQQMVLSNKESDSKVTQSTSADSKETTQSGRRTPGLHHTPPAINSNTSTLTPRPSPPPGDFSSSLASQEAHQGNTLGTHLALGAAHFPKKKKKNLGNVLPLAPSACQVSSLDVPPSTSSTFP